MDAKRIRRKAYTITEATAVINDRLRVGYSTTTVREWCRRGIIKALQPMGPGGWHRIPVVELERFLEAKTKGVDSSDNGD